MNFFTHNTAASQIHAANQLIDSVSLVVFFASVAYLLFLVVNFAAKKAQAKRQSQTEHLCFCDKQISIDECIESDCPTFQAIAKAFEDSALYGISEIQTNSPEPAPVADPWAAAISEALVTADQLQSLGIRKLKDLAVGRLTNYSRLRKDQLAQALAGKVLATEI